MKDTGIYKYLDCSTSHITEEESKTLASNPYIIGDVFNATPNEYGYWMNVPDNKEAIMELEIPKSVKDILCLALKKKCFWVKLDRDGFVHKELTKYDW